MKRLFLFICLALILASCSPAPAAPVEVTRIVERTVVVIVTATPEPPTPTPEASPTPSFARWTADQVGQVLTDQGLEFVSPTPMTKDDYGMAPMLGNGLRFLVPSICSDCGGRLIVFDNQADLEKVRVYYEDLGKQSALFFSWVFTRDNVLIQINGDLPEEQAMKYKAALEGMN